MHQQVRCCQGGPILCALVNVAGFGISVLRSSPPRVAGKMCLSKGHHHQESEGYGTLYQLTTPQPCNNCRQSVLHAYWTQSRDFLHASQRMQSTSWLERYYIGLKCSIQYRKEDGCCRFKSTLGVNRPPVFVNHTQQNRSLPKLTCYLSHSAWILFTLPDTEKQRQLLQTILCIVVFI